MGYVKCRKCGHFLDSMVDHKCQMMGDVVMKKAIDNVEGIRSTIRQGPELSERAVIFLSVVGLLDKILDDEDGVSYDNRR